MMDTNKRAGWIDRVGGTCSIATEFAMLGGLPLWPRKSYVVPAAGNVIRELPRRSQRSVVAAYAGSFGAFFALAFVFALAGIPQLPFTIVSAILLGYALTLMEERTLGRWLRRIAGALFVGALGLHPATTLLGIAGGVAWLLAAMWSYVPTTRSPAGGAGS